MTATLPALENSTTLLTLAGMKVVQVGQSMIQQQLAHLEQLIDSKEGEQDANENKILNQLEEAFQLYELNAGSSMSDLPFQRIDKWLEKTAATTDTQLMKVRKDILDFKIYLKLVHSYSQALQHYQQGGNETGILLENSMKILVQDFYSEIEKNPALAKSLKGLLKCLQQLKVVQHLNQSQDQNEYKKSQPTLNALKLLKVKMPSVMSKKWLKERIEQHLAATHSNPYFDQHLKLTSAGSLRFNRLIEAALNEQKELINADDLVVIGLMFGPSAVKAVLNNYNLMGNGTSAFPFTDANLRALLIGLAINLKSSEETALSPQAKNALEQIKNCFKTQSKLGSPAYLEELVKQFEQGKQNKLSGQFATAMWQRTYLLLRNISTRYKNYSQNWLIANINILDSEWVKKYGLSFLNSITLPNLPWKALVADIELSQLSAKSDLHVFNNNTPAVNEYLIKTLFHDLQTLSVRNFGLKNKEYRSKCLTSTENNLLKAYHLLYSKGEKSAQLDELSHQVKTLFLSKINPWDKYVDEIILDLKALSLERFIEKYPVFKEDNLDPLEFTHLKTSALGLNSSSQERQDNCLAQARELILNKIKEIYPYTRATLFSHVLAYSSALYSKDKKDLVLKLPLQSGQEENFVLKPVIHDEQGLALAMFSPESDISHSETIPLYLTFQGTHDLFSGLRDLHPVGAGMDEFHPKRAYLIKMLTAINQEIAELTQKYPHKKVNIEIFGHSLGGADSYNLLLALQEAMSQNKARTAQGYQDYNELCRPTNRHGFCHAKNKELQNTLPQSLAESLGLKERDFGHHTTENRSFQTENIQAINLEKIANISVFAKNAAGCPLKVLSALTATTAFLGMNSEYVLNDRPLDVNGDWVARTANGRGLYLADPRETFLNGKVNLAHCRINSQKGGLHNQLSHALEGRFAPLEAHQGVIYDQGPHKWLQQDAKIVRNTSRKNMKYLRHMLANPIRVKGAVVVDIWLYRKIKAILYLTLSLTAMIISPTLALAATLLLKLAQLEAHLAAKFGVISALPNQTSVEDKLLREHLISEQKQLLFSSIRTASNAKTLRTVDAGDLNLTKANRP